MRYADGAVIGAHVESKANGMLGAATDLLPAFIGCEGSGVKNPSPESIGACCL